jgi:hypothetical protein
METLVAMVKCNIFVMNMIFDENDMSITFVLLIWLL